jgi:hypothetical protein
MMTELAGHCAIYAALNVGAPLDGVEVGVGVGVPPDPRGVPMGDGELLPPPPHPASSAPPMPIATEITGVIHPRWLLTALRIVRLLYIFVYVSYFILTTRMYPAYSL